ncbi:MAG: SulP family inorganic anion transporter [Bryobacterales bacterium]|nr:SulP family inorganic anion transporter [Bryobacterales bacterium]
MVSRLRALEDTLPKSFQVLTSYDFPTFFRDLTAGITVGLVALPLALAFAIASGVPPEAGLYCAILAGFLISALGGSRTQIGGPTGAFVVVVSSIVAVHGLDGLYMCTLMAGVILVLFGITGMGSAIQFIPRPVVIGFTNGIAVLIASTQLKDFFGLTIEKVPDAFLHRVAAVAGAWETLNPLAAGIAAAALVSIFVLRRYFPRIPGAVLAMLVGTAAVMLFALPLDTVGSRFGDLPAGLPHFTVPNFRPDLMLTLLSPALTVAMLGAIESLLSAVVADRMSGDRHNPNVELVAQGLANIVSPLAGGLPATGAIARTATNIRAGARTPVAGMIHAITILAVLLFAAPLARHIPLAVLAAILLAVAYNMGEWAEIPGILRLSWTDIVVWAVTFALTVLADLTVAVEAGMILAVLLYIRGVTQTSTVTRITADDILDGEQHSLQMHEIPEGVALYRIHGPFLFGSTRKLAVVEKELNSLPRIVIIRLRNMTAIDATGLHALEHLAGALRKSGRVMLLCGMRPQPKELMERAEFRQHVGAENICATVRVAIVRARQILEEDEVTPKEYQHS